MARSLNAPYKKEKQMKKLMIALAAVAMAACANAAAWSWSSSTAAVTPGGSTALSGADIYLFFGYASSSDANTAKGALLASLREGNAISGYSQSATLNSSGVLEETAFTADKGKLYAFAVILAEDAEGNSYMFQTANKNATGADVGTAMLPFDISSTTLKGLDVTGTGAGWYQTAAVPEPTSGLLVLLGLAGLALKRKRA